MKSLNELWEENGCKPIKVIKRDYSEESVFVSIYKVPSGDFIGYWLKNGEAVLIYSYRASQNGWELYEETEEKTFYKAIVAFEDLYKESIIMFDNEERAKDLLGEDFVRLITEYPVKIKVKK